ncbi:MAG: C40 family peptidase [Sphingomonadales bacterium]|nr:C40 family peptidase [Sphingomonadales bacterium]
MKARPTFTLEGHSFVGDKRTTPIRGDLADIKLAGLLFAPHYAVPMIRSCIVPSAMMHERADGDSTGISELIYGEDFAVLDVAGKWAWGYTVHDDYLGYVALEALGQRPVPNHMVTGRSATLLAGPDAKSNTLARLHMGAKLVCGDADDSNEFLSCDGGYIFREHIAEIGHVEEDPVTLAEKLLGTPYLWGGRSGHAIDCSGLVQLVYGMKGIYLPRDTDMQQDVVGREIAQGETLRRGDLVYFPGHVGIMQDGDTIIHATAHHMQVVAEALADVAARNQGEDGGPAIIARRRLL